MKAKMVNKRQSKSTMQELAGWGDALEDVNRKQRELLFEDMLQSLNRQRINTPLGVIQLGSDRLSRLASLAKETSMALSNMPPYHPDMTINEPIAREEQVNQLNSLIEDITHNPRITLGRDGRSLSVDDVLKSDRVRGKSDETEKEAKERWRLDLERIYEKSSVTRIVDLIRNGEIDRLRRCMAPDCGLWFFSGNRNDKKVCSPKCRQRISSRKPDFKTKRQEYLKNRDAGKFAVQERSRAKATHKAK